MKVLVTGSRCWTDRDAIERELLALPSDTIIVHGGARGADSLAGEVGRQRDLAVKVYTADWDQYGRAAGVMRNEAMLRNEHPDLMGRMIDLVLAFHLNNSRGTADMVSRAKRAGIKVKVVAA